MGIANSGARIRVANIIEEGRWAGPQKRIALVSSSIKQYAVETVVLLPRRESERFRSELDKQNVSWRALPLHRLGRGWFTLVIYGATFFFDIWEIWKELRHGRYDLLHVSGGVWQFKGPIAGKLAGVPVIWHLNDTQMPKPVVMLFRTVGRLVDGFFVAGKRVQQYYLKDTQLENVPTYLVPAPVATSYHSRADIVEDVQVACLASPRIITISNVNPIKGLQTLLDAAALLKGRLNEFSIVIVGPVYSTQNAYYQILKDKIRALDIGEKVFFVGERQEVVTVLKCADVYVCSSIAEASPMAVWEAMSMGCPIVSTDVGDVALYIKNGEGGFVVPVGDAHKMADSIENILKNKLMGEKFAKNAREVACRELDIEIVAEKTASSYANVLAFVNGEKPKVEF